VVIAIGNNANPLITTTTPDIKTNKWGNIEVDDLGRTSKKFVYAAGDIVTGAATVISAMGGARKAAIGIHYDLMGEIDPDIPTACEAPDDWELEKN
jgi:glutamate synthase (NADPH/NADH) small chain